MRMDRDCPNFRQIKMNVFAESFVPQEVLDVNQCPVHYVAQAEPLKSLDTHSLFESLFPPGLLEQSARLPFRRNTRAEFLSEDEIARVMSGDVGEKETTNFNDLKINSMEEYAKWREVLHLEREAILDASSNRYKLYQKRIECRAKNSDTRVCSIKVPGIADSSPHILAGDWIFIRQIPPPLYGFNGIEIRAQISDVKNTAEEIYINWPAELPLPDRERDLWNLVIIRQSTFHLRRQAAIDWTLKWHQETQMANLVLFPVLSGPKESITSNELPEIDHSLKLIGKDLNIEQQIAISQVLNRTKKANSQLESWLFSPFLTFGPPGTGKTSTLVEMILQLLQFPDTRILACAPSISGADTLASSLSTFTEIITPNIMFRLNDATRKVETCPVNLLRFCSIDETGSFSFPTSKQLLSSRIIVATLWDSSLLFESHHTNSSIIQIREHARNTCNEYLKHVGLTPDYRAESCHHWTHLIIDEAAQGTELDSLIPLSVVLNASFPAQVVLCGDSKQLGPVVFSNSARQSGLGQSWFGRLIDQGYSDFPDSFGVHLRRNYRSHFSMLIVPSVLYYNDRLVPAASSVETHRFVNFSVAHRSSLVTGLLDDLSLQSQSSSTWPILFHSVRGRDLYEIEQSSGLSSWKNNHEAEQIVDWVKFLIQNYGVDSKEIGIMAPYRGQVKLIRSLLRKDDLRTVNVGTVEDYQGAERPIILLSVTRATSKFIKQDKEKAVGLIYQPERFNVAITRAQALLIIVGNPDILKMDLDWREFLAFCQRHGLWFGPSIRPLDCTKKSVLEFSLNLR